MKTVHVCVIVAIFFAIFLVQVPVNAAPKPKNVNVINTEATPVPVTVTNPSVTPDITVINTTANPVPVTVTNPSSGPSTVGIDPAANTVTIGRGATYAYSTQITIPPNEPVAYAPIQTISDNILIETIGTWCYPVTQQAQVVIWPSVVFNIANGSNNPYSLHLPSGFHMGISGYGQSTPVISQVKILLPSTSTLQFQGNVSPDASVAVVCSVSVFGQVVP